MAQDLVALPGGSRCGGKAEKISFIKDIIMQIASEVKRILALLLALSSAEKVRFKEEIRTLKKLQKDAERVKK